MQITESHVFDFKIVEIDMMHLMFCGVHPVGRRYEKINGSQTSLMCIDAGTQG